MEIFVPAQSVPFHFGAGLEHLRARDYFRSFELLRTAFAFAQIAALCGIFVPIDFKKGIIHNMKTLESV